MLIKNNKIIVRKCKERLFEDVLEKRGYQKLLVDGKTLIVPFHVFDEDDLFNNLKSLGIKFYAVPLSENHHYAFTTNEYSILNTFNTIVSNDEHFIDNTLLTDTIELIRLISYQTQNPKNCTYTKLIDELKAITKNPISDNLVVDVKEVGKFLDKFHLSDRMQDIVLKLENELHKRNINYKHEHDGEHFIKICLEDFVYQPILNEYRDADLVFWYNTLPASSRGQEINN